jgi:hypothetical protein
MSQILETLAPLALLIALGSALAHIKFLGAAFIADLNKLAFWVALPALIFTSADQQMGGGLHLWRLFAVMIVATLLISLLAWGATYALRLPGEARGTFVQSAFRGNLAYIGIPVLAGCFAGTTVPNGSAALTTAVVVMVLTMALYNILAVIVLQASQHARQKTSWPQMTRSIATNPLLLAGAPAGDSRQGPGIARGGGDSDCPALHRRFAGDGGVPRKKIGHRGRGTVQDHAASDFDSRPGASGGVEPGGAADCARARRVPDGGSGIRDGAADGRG